jgi:hypothetical protein
MAEVDYKQSYAWQEAIKLAQDVYTLIETLPETAQALSDQMAAVAAEVPAEIADCLLERKKASLTAVLKLDSLVELISRIYPALDTADVEHGTKQLLERLQSSHLTELVAPAVEPEVASEAAPDEDEDEDEAEPDDEGDEPDEDEDEDEAAEDGPVNTSVTISQE